jgi:hypothetical protein
MTTNWAILDVDRQKNHALAVTFQETDDAGKQYTYKVTLPQGSTKAQYLAELKKQALLARALRNKVDQIRATIDPAAIEAFINS